MYSENIVHIFAGSLVMAGVALGFFVSQWFLLIPVFVGLNLFQYGFTNFCGFDLILRKAGMRSSHCVANKSAVPNGKVG